MIALVTHDFCHWHLWKLCITITATLTSLFQKNNMFKIENNKYINRCPFMMKIPFIKLMKMDMYICYILSYQKM